MRETTLPRQLWKARHKYLDNCAMQSHLHCILLLVWIFYIGISHSCNESLDPCYIQHHIENNEAIYANWIFQPC